MPVTLTRRGVPAHVRRAPADRPLIIVNPNSDHGRTAALAPRLAEWLRELGDEGELVEARQAADATRLSTDGAARGYAPIVAVGGDGTVHAVACGLLDAQRRAPLGIVPVGSGNDYALRALNLPGDPCKALTVALHGRRRVVDAARLNTEWMINAFGVGIDANVAWDVREMVESGRAKMHGSRLYTFSAIKQVLRHYRELPKLAIEMDGARQPARRMLLAAVMIGPTAGGGYKMTPAADPGDGLLDVLLAGRMPRPKALLALPLLKGGRHTWLREVKLATARDVRLRSARPARAHVDGELITGTAFDIHIVPGALTVMAAD